MKAQSASYSAGELCLRQRFSQCFLRWGAPATSLRRKLVKCSGAQAVSMKSFRDIRRTCVALSLPAPACSQGAICLTNSSKSPAEKVWKMGPTLPALELLEAFPWPFLPRSCCTGTSASTKSVYDDRIKLCQNFYSRLQIFCNRSIASFTDSRSSYERPTINS